MLGAEIAQAQVRQTVSAITTLVDVRALDVLPRLFADAVTVDYSSLWGGEAQVMSGAALVEGWSALVPGFDATWHELGAIHVELGDGVARATCPVDARHWLGGEVWRVAGQYEFDLRLIDGRWRVSLMRLLAQSETGSRTLVERAQAIVAAR